MFDNIIAYSVRNKLIVALFVLALIIWGILSLQRISIDAVPDITNNQVQIVTQSPTLATQEVEQFITTPIELALQNLQQVTEIRSISRFGLSVITVVFTEDHDLYLARQLVGEKLKEAEENIPEGLGRPELAPITTGLGEIYNYVIEPKPGYESQYTAMELRTIQDWIVKRQLTGIEGVAEVSSMGGFLKQYEVAVDPLQLKSQNLDITELFNALAYSNENTGGAYIEKTTNTYYIRSEGLAKDASDIENIVIKTVDQRPILIKDVARVQLGHAPRFGAVVSNGREAVGAKVLMYKGANAAEVTERIKTRMADIQKSLPDGVEIKPYLVRDKLVKTAMKTVRTNLIEGGLIVVFILVLLLGNFRAGLIVASVIPLAMLFAISMMNVFGISANLMSLGAIDFGLIVDGAVIIVEAIVHRLSSQHGGKKLSLQTMNNEVIHASQKIRSSAAFGEIIILMVYIPILALVGIEGKMFKPMAQTVMLAITGALILSLTYVPMMAALFLKKQISAKKTWADHIIEFAQRIYQPILTLALRRKLLFVGTTLILFILSLGIFKNMGGEFIPTLEEGDLAIQQIIAPGSSLSQSVETAKLVHRTLRKDFPEVEDMVVNIGTAEVPTDPMPVEIGDHAIIMKPKSEWTSAENRKTMFEKMEASLSAIPGLKLEFSQPIQLRFNELMTGTKADIAIKLYGEDLDLSYKKAKEAEALIADIPGVGTVNVEQTIGMPQIVIAYDYQTMAQYGLHIKEVNQIISSAFAGQKAGVIYEGEKRFDLVVRFQNNQRMDIDNVRNLYIPLKNGAQVPLTAIAKVTLKNAPMQISRDNTSRRIVIGVNVGNTDVESLVENIQATLEEKLSLPPGYYLTYGGEFENLKKANARLSIAVPIALCLIFILLYFTFQSFAQALLIFMAIPLSAIGGIWALTLREMPFSISAGIGFIALFGVAVLNGIVLIGYFNQLKSEGITDVLERIKRGTTVRLRPVLMTASVASLGFLPMALSTSGGAEVQRPLATVVIGGLISATILTLIILPILYYWLETKKFWRKKKTMPISIILFLSIVSLPFCAHTQDSISLSEAITIGIDRHPAIVESQLNIERYQSIQDLNYQPGQTKIYYQGEGLWAGNPSQMNEWGITQNFAHPRVQKYENQYNATLLKKSRLQHSINENELRYHIRKQYIALYFQKKTLAKYKSIVNLFHSYLKKAQSRNQFGESNPLESLQISAQLKKYELLLKQNQMLIQNLENNLGKMLSHPERLTTTSDELSLSLDLPDNLTNIWVEREKVEKTLIQNSQQQLSARKLPELTLQYGAQNFFNQGWKSGVQVGVNLNIFQSNINQKIEAKSIEANAQQYQVENTLLQYQKQMETLYQQIGTYRESVQFYQMQLDQINPEIKRITELNYSAGEISYVELITALDLLIQNELGYITQSKLYQESIVKLLYLNNL